jgi:hypothetical protein
MSAQTQPTPKLTKNGISPTSTKSETPKVANSTTEVEAPKLDVEFSPDEVDDLYGKVNPDIEKETVQEFMARVARTQLAGDEAIEAREAIFKYFNRKGTNGSDYFWYQGVRVCPLGKKDEIIAREEVSTYERLHGTADGRIVRGENPGA